MEGLFVVTAVAGVVELLRRLQVRDYFAALTIVAAAAVGGVAGFFDVEGLTVTTGIVAGLAASGLITVASKVG